MFFHDQFEKFEPVCGDVPEHPFAYLPEIAARARSVLPYWTTDRMVRAAKRINEEIELYFSDLKTVAVENLRAKLQVGDEEFDSYFEWDDGAKESGQWVFKEEMREFLDIPTDLNSSEVDALKTIIENRDSCFFLPKGAPDPEIDHWPEGRTHELFAVLSLWLLAEAIDWARNPGKFGLSISGECAVKAMDAVCHAEHVREVEWLEQFHKKSLTEISRNADLRSQEITESVRQKLAAELAARDQLKRSARAELLNLKRHAKRNHAVDQVCAEWVKNPSKYTSFEKAGANFADWVVDRQLMKTIEPRAVAGWIREYAKKIGFRYR